MKKIHVSRSPIHYVSQNLVARQNLAYKTRMEQIQSFKKFLRNELISRCRKNEKYSLRAFAKSLGVPASSLSLLLNGSRPFTAHMREKIGLALGLKPAGLANYSIESGDLSESNDYQQIELSAFEVIADWYHYAILELTKVNDFMPEVKWIANALSISTQEVQVALENLTKTGFLQITEAGQWLDQTDQGFATNISPGLTSEAAKQMQRQILDQSKKALRETPLELRDHSSLTVAVNKSQLKEAREKIKNLRRELDELFSSNSDKEEVYQLSLSLFPITNTNRSKK